MVYVLRNPTFVPLLSALLVLLIGAGCNPTAPSAPTIDPAVSVSTHMLELPSGHVRFDLYRRTSLSSSPAPLVVLAHGLWRDRTRMAGWGQKLAQEGFVAAAMDMPTLADYQHNGRAINELIQSLCDDSIDGCRIDRRRIGVIGHSAGGLATFLAAAENPDIKLWVGLDPVDRHGLGAAAGAKVHARAVVVRAPPSQWNQRGNAIELLDSLPHGGTDTIVSDAIHIDPEWPSDWTMRFLMGQTSAQRREMFVNHALVALRGELMRGTEIADPRATAVTDAKD